MKNIPLVRANTLLPFVKFLDQIGSPTERLLKQAKLPVFALADPEALLSTYQALNFIERAAQLEKMEMLGIWVGQQTEIADLGLFGQLLQQSLTLYDLLRTIEWMVPALSSRERIWLVEDGNQVWLNHQLLCPSGVKDQQANLYTVLLCLKAIQLAAGPDWNPLQLRLRAGHSRKIAEIKEFVNIPVRFDQPNSAIAISKTLLSLPLRNRLSAHLSLKNCCHNLQTTAPSIDLAKSLEQLLQSLLRDGYPNIRLAAAASGTSVRSFQRRLKEANLSYSKIVEQVRFDRAIQLLRDPSIQLIDIAMELGYTDAANFTRAFKRWTGVAPTQFRHLH